MAQPRPRRRTSRTDVDALDLLHVVLGRERLRQEGLSFVVRLQRLDGVLLRELERQDIFRFQRPGELSRHDRRVFRSRGSGCRRRLVAEQLRPARRAGIGPHCPRRRPSRRSCPTCPSPPPRPPVSFAVLLLFFLLLGLSGLCSFLHRAPRSRPRRRSSRRVTFQLPDAPNAAGRSRRTLVIGHLCLAWRLLSPFTRCAVRSGERLAALRGRTLGLPPFEVPPLAAAGALRRAGGLRLAALGAELARGSPRRRRTSSCRPPAPAAVTAQNLPVLPVLPHLHVQRSWARRSGSRGWPACCCAPI